MTDTTLNSKLVTACQQGQVDEARRLIEAGANPHHNQGEALYEAAAEGHSAVVELLIEHEVKHPQALARAAENGDLAVVTLLVTR